MTDLISHLQVLGLTALADSWQDVVALVARQDHAKNIVQHAVLAGHTALFITASDLLLDLGKQESARTLEAFARAKPSWTPRNALSVDPDQKRSPAPNSKEPQLSEPPDADPHVRWCGRGLAGQFPPPLSR